MCIYPIYNHDNICYYPSIGLFNIGDRMIDDKDVKPIKGFDGYTISSTGIIHSFRSGIKTMVKESYIPSTSGLTFRSVQLIRKDGKQVRRYVHRLVYETFNDVFLSSFVKVYFKNYNCFDCSVDNLTLNKEDYELQRGEEWVQGYEGRYFILKNDIYSVLGEYPKKLKPYSFGKVNKYSLTDCSGKVSSYYLNVATNL